MHNCKLVCKRVYADELGGVLPLFGLILLALIAAVGLAVDYGRAQMMQSKLHAAVDAGVLAAGSKALSLTDQELRDEVRKFTNANFPQEYMGTTYELNDGDIVIVRDNAASKVKITATASNAKVGTSFMSVFGNDFVEIGATAEATQERSRGFEMVMVLDNSDSMDISDVGGKRRDAVVTAAKKLIDMLYGTQNSFPNLFIGLVPFSHNVNPGTAKAAGSDWIRGSGGWVTVNSNPAVQPYQALQPDPSLGNMALPGDLNCVYADTDITAPPTIVHEMDIPSRDNAYATTDTPPAAGQVPPSLFVAYPPPPFYGDCVPSMTPFKQDKNDIKAALDGVTTRGGTRTDLGMQWGWNMLSPKWKGMWNHQGGAGMPLNYHTTDMDKVVIFLTDGQNCCSAQNLIDANTRLSQICSNMKHEGIIIYSIAIHVAPQETQDLLRSCATSPDHYFPVDGGGDEIEAVFGQIADSLMNLRLSK